MAIICCSLVILYDPKDRYGAFKYVEKMDALPSQEMDKPFGYERTLEKERTRKPELYEA